LYFNYCVHQIKRGEYPKRHIRWDNKFSIKCYMGDFPFEYLIVTDTSELGGSLADILRQYFKYKWLTCKQILMHPFLLQRFNITFLMIVWYCISNSFSTLTDNIPLLRKTADISIINNNVKADCSLCRSYDSSFQPCEDGGSSLQGWLSRRGSYEMSPSEVSRQGSQSTILQFLLFHQRLQLCWGPRIHPSCWVDKNSVSTGW
jgi:hypothetical protein